MRWIREQLFFERYFFVITQSSSVGWRDVDVVENETRILFDALDEKEIETCYLNYVQNLREQEKREQYVYTENIYLSLYYYKRGSFIRNMI